jgi:hypothetical protein
MTGPNVDLLTEQRMHLKRNFWLYPGFPTCKLLSNAVVVWS